MNASKKQCMGWAAAAVLLLFAVQAPVRAADSDGAHFSIGGRAMYFDPKDADDGTWSGGVQTRFHFNNAWALEGSVDYRRSDYENDTVLVHTYPVQATLLAALMPGQMFRPYILGGVGWYFTTIENPGVDNDDTDDRFGLHAGAGLELFMNEAWSIDGSYRYVWLDNIQTRGANLLEKEYNDSGSMVTMALNYHFH